MNYPKILAIESSCDETAAAVIAHGTHILSSFVSSSSTLHALYGGIVPEIAAREQLDYIIPVLTQTLAALPEGKNLSMRDNILQNIDAIAVSHGPGLIGSLLVGVETAKTLAYATKKPLIPVNHVLAHMYANFLVLQNAHHDTRQIEFPAISLVVSGGHTELYKMDSHKSLIWLGGTIDDAAGEAFDKTARLLGFENRGGVAIQESAAQYDTNTMLRTIRLPRPMLDKKNVLNFSFSGLKTAILREVAALKTQNMLNEDTIRQLSYEVQEAITDVLVKKTLLAQHQYSAKSILISGGVAANLRLREKFTSFLAPQNISFFSPPVSLCTDNATYIGSYAYFRGSAVDWKNITAVPDLSVEI